MISSTAKLPTRAFVAGFFAAVALGTAALLEPFLGLPTLSLKIALPLLAAACAYAWAWLLHPRRGAAIFGPARGFVVALLAYLSFTAILAVCGYREAGLLIVGFVWVPFPSFALAMGAFAGGTNLQWVRSRIDASAAGARCVWTISVAAVRSTYARLDARAAEPSAGATVTMIVSNCLLLAGGALGLAWLHPQPALAEAGGDMSLRLLPAAAALILAAIGWMCGRVLLAVAPAGYRLRIALMAAILVGVAIVRFSIDVVA